MGSSHNHEARIVLPAFIYQNFSEVERTKTTFLPLASRVFRQCIKSDTSEEKHKKQFSQSKSKDARVLSKKDVNPDEDQHVE
jgi:hypothetical protein